MKYSKENITSGNDENKNLIFIKTIFENNKIINKFLKNKTFCNKLKKQKLFKTIYEEKGKENLYINLFVFAIDNEDLEFLDFLIENDPKKKSRDIIYDIYKINSLDRTRLVFLLNNRNDILKISSPFIKHLLQTQNTFLLDIIFRYSRFYDPETILDFCYCYKNKIGMSNKELKK